MNGTGHVWLGYVLLTSTVFCMSLYRGGLYSKPDTANCFSIGWAARFLKALLACSCHHVG